jgi:ERCC4-type nuclease
MKLRLPKEPNPPKVKASDVIIPDGFVLVIDTREQLPLFTSLDIPKETRVLHNGDYSIAGFENLFAIERKQVSDFFSYIGKEHDKTVRKLRRLSEFEVALLVVEASFDDLICPQVYTKMQPGHVYGFVKSLVARYGIPFFMHRDRAVLERFVLETAVYYYELKTGVR